PHTPHLLSFPTRRSSDLDEATSSVGPFTELHIQEALERLLRDRIALVVAHRLSTIVHADKICVILDGGIAAQGRHEELLQTSPRSEERRVGKECRSGEWA